MRRKDRGYQEDFYNLSRRVRDPVSRHRQGEKIAWALTHHAGQALSTAVCLDLGCSSGVIASVLAPLFRATIGLDYDATALTAAEPITHLQVRLVRGDGMRLPFADGSVNVVICAQVYEHVPNAASLFREIHRVLAPNGTVFFSGPNWLFPLEPHYSLPFLHWLPGKLADRYLQLTGKGSHYYERLSHKWKLRRMMRQFAIRDITADVLQNAYTPPVPALESIIQMVPVWLWRSLAPFFPGFNWILYKPEE